MRKIREVLRLHFELKLGQRQIAHGAHVSQSTVSDYVARFEAASLPWPLPDELSDPQLEAVLFPVAPRARALESDRPRPDFAQVHQELQQHKHTTLQLLWEEYRATTPEGLGYSRFCYHYQQWKRQHEVVMRQEHHPGEKLFIDWAGDQIALHDGHGSLQRASLFVAVLGASNYTYAEASGDQTTPNWIGAHLRAFDYIGGLPQLLVPDNAKTAVSKACRYEPDLNPTYQEMAKHYGVGVLPTRRCKPRDKAKVETGVLIAERWILAALRHRQFFSLAELNRVIRELLDRLNQRPFKKLQGCRRSVWLELDRPALRPLPAERFELAEWEHATVNIDYHVEFDHSFYSVPYQLVRQKVEVRSTASTVEIFHRGQRVASHVRALKARTPVTKDEHRPKSHRAHLEWPPSRMIHWAQTIGPNTAQVVAQILESYPHPEMGYRSCLGIIRLGQRYPTARLEAAAARALAGHAVSYKSIASILKHSLDQSPVSAPQPARTGSTHNNVRGAAYYQ